VQIVYSRVSTATQSLLRQRHILTEVGLLVRTAGVAERFRPADGVLLFEDPATTSKTPALERPAFAKVAAAGRRADGLRAVPAWDSSSAICGTSSPLSGSARPRPKAATAVGRPR
jgi:hypothetical protein